MDGKKDGLDNDGDSWTDQETFLLLEGIDKYKENWNAVAEHVGTKSKIQCLHHFLRLPVEDGLLENIKVPEASFSSKVQNNGFLHSNSNGSTSGLFIVSLLKNLTFFCVGYQFWLMQNASGSVFKLPQLFALGSLPQSGEAGDLPFINTANPVMSLVSDCRLCCLLCHCTAQFKFGC